MRKVGDKPNCCEKADKYIWFGTSIVDNEIVYRWIMFFYDEDHADGYEGSVISQIGYCPFCGKKLDWIDEMLTEEQEAAHED